MIITEGIFRRFCIVCIEYSAISKEEALFDGLEGFNVSLQLLFKTCSFALIAVSKPDWIAQFLRTEKLCKVSMGCLESSMVTVFFFPSSRRFKHLTRSDDDRVYPALSSRFYFRVDHSRCPQRDSLSVAVNQRLCVDENCSLKTSVFCLFELVCKPSVILIIHWSSIPLTKVNWGLLYEAWMSRFVFVNSSCFSVC
jgi:hypothetical protein